MENVLDSKTVLLLIIASSLIAYGYSFISKPDPREPPLIPSLVPYIGHLVGMIRNGQKYYSNLSAKHPFPAYRLKMPGPDTIIINTPELATAAQRNSKAMSFGPFIMEFTKRVTRPSKMAMNILLKNMTGQDGKSSFLVDITKAMHGALSPGAELDRMNKSMVESLSSRVEDLLTQPGPVGLFEWTRRSITLASTDATYGPKNPFKDPEVEKAFWTFDRNSAMALLDIMPYITARQGHNARRKVQTGFTNYFKSGGHEQGSALIQVRYDSNCKYGIPLEDMGKFEFGLAIGLLVNTAPATFWTLLNVLSNASLLEDLRHELSAVTQTAPQPNGPQRHVNITHAIETCPILISIFQETLRLKASVGSSRKVLKDTLLADRYLLKAGSMLQMPSRVLHFDPASWGPTAHVFNPRRFLRDDDDLRKTDLVKPPPGAFQSFGGGVSYCPGRHFAMHEVVAAVVMVVLRFDVCPAGGGEWVVPSQDKIQLSTSVGPPDWDVMVEVRRRKGFEDGGWRFGIGRRE